MENRGKIEMIKNKYPVGTRIKLNYMEDNYSVPRGTCGTVEYVDDEGQIGMKWDNGSSLSLIYGVDSFEIITNKELNHNFKKNKEFIKLRNKEDEIFRKSLNTKTEEEKNNIQIEYNNIKEDIKNHVSSFYDNHTRLNKNIERGR